MLTARVQQNQSKNGYSRIYGLRKGAVLSWYIKTNSTTPARKEFHKKCVKRPRARTTALRWVEIFNSQHNVEYTTECGRA